MRYEASQLRRERVLKCFYCQEKFSTRKELRLHKHEGRCANLSKVFGTILKKTKDKDTSPFGVR